MAGRTYNHLKSGCVWDIDPFGHVTMLNSRYTQTKVKWMLAISRMPKGRAVIHNSPPEFAYTIQLESAVRHNLETCLQVNTSLNWGFMDHSPLSLRESEMTETLQGYHAEVYTFMITTRPILQSRRHVWTQPSLYLDHRCARKRALTYSS